jgi:septum formation protein
MSNHWQMPIILASGSPRRAELLSVAGVEAIVCPPACDDGVFTCGTMHVEKWVQSLAVFKAQNVLNICNEQAGTVLAADTVCVVDDMILGKPSSLDHARTMLALMLNRSHEVYTGWCLASLDGLQLDSGFEQSTLAIGSVEEEEIEKYLRSNQWKMKAGGYNLSERVSAGWSIECKGDPTNVMGLPMNRLKQELCRSEQ